MSKRIWLTNPTKKRRAARRPTATRKRAKRKPPNGFATWSAYMASIRPTSKGGRKMAKRRRKRRATTSAPRRRRRSTTTTKRRRRANPPVVYRANPRRRRYRRNSPLGLSPSKIINTVKDGAVGAVSVVGGELATKFIRGNLLNMQAGETMSSIAEIGIATGLGVLGQKFLGAKIARDIVVGGYAGVLRATLKQMNNDSINEVLGDYAGGNRYIVPRSRLGSYVGNGEQLGGYVGAGAVQAENDGY